LGIPADVAKGGVAFGVSWEEPTAAAAGQQALSACHEAEGVPASTTSLCRVVHTFQGQCVAVAIDPEPGTTGFGWGKGYTSTQARYEAIESCKTTAGDRAQACTVIDTTCD
jgi:hypothetical protein